jgi:hypothetical protein
VSPEFMEINKNMYNINVHVTNMPKIITSFYNLVGISRFKEGTISKKHRFYEVIKFYERNKKVIIKHLVRNQPTI